jgi:transcriptional regulator with XRE-family HTH domain
MNSLPSIDLSVVERLKADAEFRQAYFIAESSGMIARQLIRLRKKRGLSQTEVAKQLETRQPAISRVESADYRNWSFNTLRRLAEAMDARIRVLIEPSEDVLVEYGETANADESKAQPQSVQFKRFFGEGGSQKPAQEPKLKLLKTADEPKSAAASDDSLKQRAAESVFNEQLEGQRPPRRIGNLDMAGATCN